MTAKIYSLSLNGLDSNLVEVEVDIKRGKNKINIIGLPDKAVSEAQDRIIPALKNSIYQMPKGHITVNLAPANIHKSGSYFDLPIIIGILLESSQVRKDLSGSIVLGEVSLEGKIRSVNGILTLSDGAKNHKFKEIIVPFSNRKESALVEGIDVIGIKSVDNLFDFFGENILPYTIQKDQIKQGRVLEDDTYDMKYIKGQEHAKRALEIAAAGNHNCLMVGTPGSGKTYLSKSMKSILPDMSYKEKIEVTRIYSAVGKLNSGKFMIEDRPFRSPHHTSSQVSLVGGGSYPRPGEVTLAHRGVLFLDEFAEFSSKSLESLRQPLEDKVVQISRATGTLEFPANFILIAAMNPCKCGYFGDPDRDCSCSVSERMKYAKKVSGPVLDRIDLQVKVNKVRIDKLTKDTIGESSELIQSRVQKARDIQKIRFLESKHKINSDMTQSDIKRFINLNKGSLEILKSAIESMNLTARSYYRTLKVSRTIADLAESDSVKKDHIAEALSYRL